VIDCPYFSVFRDGGEVGRNSGRGKKEKKEGGQKEWIKREE
jgi:hypothetical protein